MKYCSKCGASVAPGASFCAGCGSSLTAKPASPGGFWKGVAAAVVGVVALVGLLWAAMGTNSADRRSAASEATELEAEAADIAVTEAEAPSSETASRGAENPDVVVEEPGFVGRLLGEKPRIFVTVSEGQALELELGDAISTESAQTGDPFEASLSEAVLVDEHEALPKGSRVSGHIAHAERSDKVKGRAKLTLELDEIELPSGDRFRFEADPLQFEARSTQKDDAIKIGGASGVGAVVGGIVGGKKGAAIGAGVGAGAGTGVVLSTRGEEVVLGKGTALEATLRTDITVEVVARNEPDPSR